jgi:uncharacterized protein (UPF0332 family)
MSDAPMQFDEKARENLEAVDRLRPNEDGSIDCLANAVANRAYYAAYHAVAHRAQERHLPFTADRDYYRHDRLPDDAARWGILGEEARRDLKQLHDTRVKADYYEDPVELDEAEIVANLAAKLVRELLG